MATHSSILAWEIPWTGEPCGLQSMGSQQTWLQLSDSTAEGGKPGTERQRAQDIAYMWGLKKKVQVDLFMKQKQRHECRKQMYGYQGIGERINWEIGTDVYTPRECVSDCDPVDCSLPGSSVHGILQASSHFLLQGIFPTQELNLGLLYCWQILYCPSHEGSPHITLLYIKEN